MLIIKSTDNLQNADQRKVLRAVQKLADQVSCLREEMDNVHRRRSNLLRLPHPLLPDFALQLDKILHENMVRIQFQIRLINTNQLEAKHCM